MLSIWGDDPSVRQDRDGALLHYRNSIPTIKYSAVVKICDTWDVLLFSGNGPFSIAEQVVTNSVFSHIGTVYRDPESKECYNWESTSADQTIDMLTGSHKRGPRLIPLKESIVTYLDTGGNYVVYRKLYTPYDEKRGEGGARRGYSKEKQRDILNWMKDQSQKTYEEKLWELPAAYYKRTLYPRGPDASSYFCSELVADSWKFGDIPLYRESDLYCPQDFSIKDEALWDLEDKNKGYHLGKEYRIVLDT